MHEVQILSDIATAIVAATAAALLARLLRQPLILGYLLAGVAVGPVGLGLVHDHETIELISEIGLILLLFIIGLEMDVAKLLSAGRALVLAGILQFPIGVALGIWFFSAMGLAQGGGRFDAAYAAVAVSLSSTMIVVKLLYDKFELATLPGRLTLGVLVFQDVWAILVLAIQPSLLNPSPLIVGTSLFKGVLLIVAALGASRMFLPTLFAFIAKVPELMLVTALAWCFLISGIASALGLSREMGALVAGIALSTLPYNLDVIAKVINIRDFFVTLFFVALGMQIPVPSTALIVAALATSLFLVIGRFASVFPILYASGQGLRTSLLPTINLAQMSEFSLVVAALGLSLGHISADTVAMLTFTFALTSVGSTYAIGWNHEIERGLSLRLKAMGLPDKTSAPEAADHKGEAAIVLLGFYRDASSILHQFEMEEEQEGHDSVLREIQVIDFNPEVLEELKRRNIACLYGDVASQETLHHAAIHHAEVIVCTLPDSILKGTSNQRLLKQLLRSCPKAKIIVASETISGARLLYDAGAHFVFVPRIHSAHRMAEVIRTAREEGLDQLRAEEYKALQSRDEVLS
ncbi:MAG: cation:proton antiporter [Vicinamibacteria bacterium]